MEALAVEETVYGNIIRNCERRGKVPAKLWKHNGGKAPSQLRIVIYEISVGDSKKHSFE